MAQITEDYVSFEIAKLLKEKGFNAANCQNSPHFAYNRDGRFSGPSWDTEYHAPTLQMAMKWLREKHNIFLSIQQHLDMSYVWYIYKNGISKGCDRESHNNSYEQACEAAIKYCLKNHLKDVK